MHALNRHIPSRLWKCSNNTTQLRYHIAIIAHQKCSTAAFAGELINIGRRASHTRYLACIRAFYSASARARKTPHNVTLHSLHTKDQAYRRLPSALANMLSNGLPKPIPFTPCTQFLLIYCRFHNFYRKSSYALRYRLPTYTRTPMFTRAHKIRRTHT